MHQPLDKNVLKHARLLITAGPTHEPIDDVRYLANRSSGRMGLALARAAAQRAAATTLLLGPTHLPPPNTSHTSVMRFQSTADLQRLLTEQWPIHDILIMAAAVADYRPINNRGAQAGASVHEASSSAPARKLRRSGQSMTLHLESTPDLLAELAAVTKPNQVVIGFALEPADQLIDSARDKLSRKQLDAIVANPLETMDAETVNGTLLLRDGTVLTAPPAMAKEAFAAWLLDQMPAIIEVSTKH